MKTANYIVFVDVNCTEKFVGPVNKRNQPLSRIPNVDEGISFCFFENPELDFAARVNQITTEINYINRDLMLETTTIYLRDCVSIKR